MKPLPRSFYSQDTVKVAKELLGKTLNRKIRNGFVSGIITETEAYRFIDDPASHAFTGETSRNKAMFGQVGRAYVYFTYGMYFCFNAVARDKDVEAGAVLIRSIKPVKGIEKMIKNRKTDDLFNLTNGPAKITQAFEISKKNYGEDLTKSPSLYITEGVKNCKFVARKRVGIKNGVDKLWNFKICD